MINSTIDDDFDDLEVHSSSSSYCLVLQGGSWPQRCVQNVEGLDACSPIVAYICNEGVSPRSSSSSQ
eukprot:5865946-Karenia_brevis.AAC.1